MKQSAGLLLFRKRDKLIEYLLVHPGGPYFTNKHEGWWTIPKGEIMDFEKPFDTALREFKEETGYSPTGPFINLEYVTQKAGKKVFCWACEGDFDVESFTCNTFKMEWPPKSGKFEEFQEIDKAGWFEVTKAQILINEKQFAFIERLQKILETQDSSK